MLQRVVDITQAPPTKSTLSETKSVSAAANAPIFKPSGSGKSDFFSRVNASMTGTRLKLSVRVDQPVESVSTRTTAYIRNGGMHPDGIMQSTDDVTLGLATRFMEINKMEAHKNFGNSADNMTAVVCTIYPSKTSCSR